MSGTIVFVYNTAKYLYRFRAPLIRALQQRDAAIVAMTPPDEAVSSLQEMGVRTIPIRLRSHSLNPLQDMATLRELTRMLRRQCPKAVLNFTIKPVIYGSLAAHRAGVRDIYSMIPGLGLVFARQDWRSRLLQNVVLTLYRSGLRYNRRVFFQNEVDRDFFLARKIVTPQQSVVVNGSGIDTEEYQPQTGAIPEQVVFMASRLLWHKGVRQFVEAAAVVKRKFPAARFVLAGFTDGSADSVAPEYLQQQTRTGLVEFVGELADVRPWIAKSQCVVLPTYYREGLPRFLLEGMAMGKAVVTTRVPGCQDLVEEGGNGFLVAPRDSASLADAINGLLEDPRLAVRMGRCSRQIVLERYEVGKVTGRILAEMNH